MSAGSVFKMQLDAAIAKAKDRANQCVRKIVLDVGTRLVERSPVGDATYWKHPAPKGYVGGRFRGSWDYGVGTEPSGADTIDASGETSIGRITDGMPEQALGQVHYIINALPYAERIENGWSRQAPQGVVGLTVIELGGIVDAAAQEVKGS
jgi:hypothetical protein